MIAFLCTGCGKQHSAKEDLAGKKVKCRACGNLTVIPAQAAVPAPTPDNMPTLAPPAAPSTGRFPKAPSSSLAAAASPPTHGHSGAAHATHDGGAADPGHDSGLTDFLSPPQADDELGRLGKYRILKILGHGGMGVVFKAEDPKLKRLVAVKAMLPTMAASANAGQRFLREAQAMAALKHDHVVTIYQVDEERGVPFLAMEFLAGEPLDERLRRDNKLPLPELLRVGREIAEGLAAAHERGLIHRDIKPANVWLEAPRGRVKILDFGLARAAAQESGLTQQGAIIGTPAYMAPEQANGAAVDARSDLFSLGVVLYRLSTGKRPFKGNDTVSTLMSVVMDHPDPPRRLNPDLPQEFSDLVMKLLEKDPARRPASAAEVAAALQVLETTPIRKRAAGKEPVTVDAPAHLAAGAASAVAAPAPRGRWRVPAVAALALLGALALGGGGGALALVLFRTAEGDYVIDTDDPDFAFAVAKDGGVTLEDHKTNHKYQMKVLRQDHGEYELEVSDPGSDLEFQTKTFTIKRGEKVALKSWFVRKVLADSGKPPAPDPVQPATPADDPWLRATAALPMDKRVQPWLARMKELNPGFTGQTMYNIDKSGAVTLKFQADNVTDISPLEALTGLQRLHCRCGADNGVKSPLADLSPLKGMKLTSFTCSYTRVSDLTTLKGMPLDYLDCGNTGVADLSPLRGANLTFLDCGGTGVADLSPLKGMRLNYLDCANTRVADLSPLKGMPLQSLSCDYEPGRDADILRSIKTLVLINNNPANEVLTGKGIKTGRPVDEAWIKAIAALPADRQVQAVMAKMKELNPGFCGAETHYLDNAGNVTNLDFLSDKVMDISPLRALPDLQFLGCHGLGLRGNRVQARFADLSPLKDMKLTNLGFSYTRVSDLTPLKGMPLRYLDCGNTAVSDLTPLKDLPLTTLWCPGTAISDLTPLKDTPLQSLAVAASRVSDLSPLKGVNLTFLDCANTKVADLSPLKGLPLQQLTCDFKPERDAEILRSIKALERINGKRATDFWKDVDAKKP